MGSVVTGSDACELKILLLGAQEASQIRLQQQDNSATWDYVGDSDPDPSAHGGTASEGSGRGGDGNGATDGGSGAADDGNGFNGDGSEGAQFAH